MKLNWRQHGSFGLIALVILITLQQILPTLVYYTKPIDSILSATQVIDSYNIEIQQIDKKQSLQHTWLKAFCKKFKLSATIQTVPNEPQLLKIKFDDEQSNSLFKQYLPTAVQLSSRLLGSLWVIPGSDLKESLVVTSKLWETTTLKALPQTYVNMGEGHSKEYRNLLQTWELETLESLQHDPQVMKGDACVRQALQKPINTWNEDLTRELAHLISAEELALGNDYHMRKIALLFQIHENPRNTLNALLQKLQTYTSAENDSQAPDVATSKHTELKPLVDILERAKNHLPEHTNLLTRETLSTWISGTGSHDDLPFTHPYIQGIKLDETNHGEIHLVLHHDLEKLLSKKAKGEAQLRTQEYLNSHLYELGTYLQQAGLGEATCTATGAILKLDPDNHQACTAVDLQGLLQQESIYLQQLADLWKPKNELLQSSQFKIFTAHTYLDSSTSSEDKLLCLILDPMGDVQIPGEPPIRDPKVIFKGFDFISSLADSAEDNFKQSLIDDLQRLQALLASRGYQFFGNYGESISQWKGSNFFANPSLFQETVRNFSGYKLLGRSSTALLELGTYGEWAKNMNSREDDEHKELIQWHEDWRVASSDLNPMRQAFAIEPPHGLFSNNLALSWRKLLRGDAKRVLKWGLDLSGGRTVRLAIYDANHNRLVDSNLLVAARNELVQRINRLGVSEVAARIEGEHLVIDFPSSQGYSSKELIQATTMNFHLVNEHFCSPSSPLKNDVEEFLSQVWNEAVATHRLDARSLNAIAYRLMEEAKNSPSDTAGKRLYNCGLKFAPSDYIACNALNEEFSMIAHTKEDARMKISARHPLLLVMRNWALQGCDLSEVSSGYDPQHGNILTFEVKSKSDRGDNPQESFWLWTSRFSGEQIAGSDLETLTSGHGWRMAVILNDEIVSAPALSSGLRDRAMIFGQFSPRDVAKLSAELRAGSLSFSPQILSEENISPELGQYDRAKGMFASAISLLAVIGCMVGYYRFGGFIASLAVLFNLLIVWAVMQNLGAALTLPGLAGLVLTMGMAVDANVLVFERIREELREKRLILEALRVGYSRAFSAIIDSNLTTILAALILVQFDSGPIKGFAMTIIIGIASSMFTALFITRTFFEAWFRARPTKTLNMANWFKRPNLPFLAWSKPFIIISLTLSALGLGLLWQARHQVLGMDFVGGYGFNISLAEGQSKQEMIQALGSIGLSHESFDVRELGQTRKLKVYLSHSLDQPGCAFHNMKEDSERLEWLEQKITPVLNISNTQWTDAKTSWTSVSGELSQSMRTQALVGLLLALGAILIYLALRFEWLFALASVIALSFDVLVSFAAIGCLRALGLPMQLDLQAIGAIMTIVGYALNDKIIVFDRVREEKQHALLQESLLERALRATLSRTIMTSCTILIVLLVLDFLGGPSLLSFSMIMTVGVIMGTLSSLFVAPAILLALAKRAAAKSTP